MRRNSEETLTTLVNEPNDSDADVESLLSRQETLHQQPISVFGRTASQYSTVHEYPIVSRHLVAGVLVFQSMEHFEDYKAKRTSSPLLCTASPIISGIFKPNAPFMTISHYPESQRTEFCKVYFKVSGNNVSHYTLEFMDGSLVVLLNNNSHRPSVDFVYKETKVRILGVTTSTYGNGFLRCYIMPPSAQMLCDEQISNQRLVAQALENNLFRSQIEKQHRVDIQKNMRQAPAISTPFATYMDHDMRLGPKFAKKGTIKIFSCDEKDDLVFMCVLLVLREQENRKMRGGRPREV